MDKKHFLLNFFKEDDFTQDELQRIIPKFREIIFNKNEYLLNEGKIENNYWIIENGFIRSYIIDTNGTDITTDFYSTGSIVIDWTSFFLRNATRENIQALTDCICWQLDFETFQSLFHSIRTFREQGRARLVNSYFELKRHSLSMIANQARERYMQLLSDKPNIVQNVPLKHIATYLGITDTSLSRIRKEITND